MDQSVLCGRWILWLRNLWDPSHRTLSRQSRPCKRRRYLPFRRSHQWDPSLRSQWVQYTMRRYLPYHHLRQWDLSLQWVQYRRRLDLLFHRLRQWDPLIRNQWVLWLQCRANRSVPCIQWHPSTTPFPEVLVVPSVQRDPWCRSLHFAHNQSDLCLLFGQCRLFVPCRPFAQCRLSALCHQSFLWVQRGLRVRRDRCLQPFPWIQRDLWHHSIHFAHNPSDRCRLFAQCRLFVPCHHFAQCHPFAQMDQCFPWHLYSTIFRQRQCTQSRQCTQRRQCSQCFRCFH